MPLLSAQTPAIRCAVPRRPTVGAATIRIGVFALITGAALATEAESQDAGSLTDRGAYLATVMDCAGCHMPRGFDGVPLFESGLSGGNVGFEIPGMGIFWAPNLTPSKTGLGSWSDEDVATAITGGLRPDGRSLAPVMPWPAYAALNESDDLHWSLTSDRFLPQMHRVSNRSGVLPRLRPLSTESSSRTTDDTALPG